MKSEPFGPSYIIVNAPKKLPYPFTASLAFLLLVIALWNKVQNDLDVLLNF